jgi:hypothetical protein
VRASILTEKAERGHPRLTSALYFSSKLTTGEMLACTFFSVKAYSHIYLAPLSSQGERGLKFL